MRKLSVNKEKNIVSAVDTMKILAHPVRLSILCDLMHHSKMSAGEICERQSAYASQSQVSQYLAVLRRNGFVTSKKMGQNVIYTFSSPLIKSIIKILYKEYCS